MRVLVTGGAGFIGSNFIRFFLREHADAEVTNFDALTYAGNLENLAGVAEDPRYRFVRGDITDREAVEEALRQDIDAIIHFAAETHVDRSLEDAAPFLRTNVLGTHTLLEAARKRAVGRFIQIGTDEVYGSAVSGTFFKETSPLAPSSPYAASKTAADLLVLSYVHTYKFSAVVLRCSNNYGPYQFPEKLIPLMIANAMEDKSLPVYGDGQQVRDWIFVEDYCSAIDCALEKGKIGEVYNVGGVAPKANLEVIHTLLKLLGKSESLIQYVEDRLGHDRRYAIDSTKISRELGWSPRHTFEKGLERTVHWYCNHPDWLERCRSGAYRDYYRRHYEERAKMLEK